MKKVVAQLSLEEIKRIMTSTSGHKKLVNYLKGIIREEPFNKEITQLREKYGIDCDKNKTGFSFGSDLMDDVIRLLEKYHLEFECFEFMMSYVAAGEFVEEFIGNMLFTEGILDTQGTPDETIDKLFPVVIRVSPYATKRDILDYVKKMYRHFIRPVQEIYKVKTTLGRVKTKKDFIQERNDFIYNNRHLPRKKVMHMVTDNFGPKNTIDYGYIGKIISIEKKKRKEL